MCPLRKAEINIAHQKGMFFMRNMEYLKDMPIAVLGGGAAGKTCAADMKLAGKEVRLYDAMPFAAASLKDVDKTGILLDGVQRNK